MDTPSVSLSTVWDFGLAISQERIPYMSLAEVRHPLAKKFFLSWYTKCGCFSYLALPSISLATPAKNFFARLVYPELQENKEP
jgi:hypothetical protein